MYAAVENPRARRCETDGRSSCFITNDASYLEVQFKQRRWPGGGRGVARLMGSVQRGHVCVG